LQIAQKMIDSFEIKWLTGLTESISKHKSLHNKVIKESKKKKVVEKIQTITSEAMKESITLMISSNGDCANH
jgi:hypothetical protein